MGVAAGCGLMKALTPMTTGLARSLQQPLGSSDASALLQVSAAAAEDRTMRPLPGYVCFPNFQQQ